MPSIGFQVLIGTGKGYLGDQLSNELNSDISAARLVWAVYLWSDSCL
jgi:hypothetical protein